MSASSILEPLGRALAAATSVKTLGLIAGLGVGALLLVTVEGPAVIRWFRDRGQVAQQKVDTKVTEATAAIGIDAIERGVAHDREIVRIRTITQEGAAHVLIASGADQRAPAVARALHDSLCRSPSYAAEPDCAALRRDRAGSGAAAPDSGSPAPR